MKMANRQLLAITLIAPAAFFAGYAVAHEAEGGAKAMPEQNNETPFGHPGTANKATRTVPVTLLDTMRFDPASIKVKQGETVIFRITNGGNVDHEFVLGDRADIQAHADMMKQMPGMTHSDANMIRIAPGKSGDIVWTFSKVGKFMYACLVPGHWEAGMQGSIAVTAVERKAR